MLFFLEHLSGPESKILGSSSLQQLFFFNLKIFFSDICLPVQCWSLINHFTATWIVANLCSKRRLAMTLKFFKLFAWKMRDQLHAKSRKVNLIKKSYIIWLTYQSVYAFYSSRYVIPSGCSAAKSRWSPIRVQFIYSQLALRPPRWSVTKGM